MKAPDKLYIEIDNKAHVYFGLQPESAVEYIRKDALMEWAKECFRLQDKGSWYSKGAADAFSEVINKLNSM